MLVPKPSRPWRFCIYYWRLNAIKIRDRYPIPWMDDCEKSVSETTWFSTMGTNLGFWKLSRAKEDQYKPTFTCQSGNCMFRRMSFSFTNAPLNFPETLDIVFSGFICRSCIISLGDVIVFYKLFDAHLKDGNMAPSTLRKADVFFNLKKCSFFTDSIKYLGHIIKPGALTINEARAISHNQLQRTPWT